MDLLCNNFSPSLLHIFLNSFFKFSKQYVHFSKQLTLQHTMDYLQTHVTPSNFLVHVFKEIIISVTEGVTVYICLANSLQIFSSTL